MRETSEVKELRKAGAVDPQRVQKLLSQPSFDNCITKESVALLREAPDVDGAVISLLRLIEILDKEFPALAQKLKKELSAGDSISGKIVFRLLGTSRFFGDWLVSHPEEVYLILDPPVDFTSLESLENRIKECKSSEELRIAYYSELIKITLLDLATKNPLSVVSEVSRAISDLVSYTLDSALQIAKAQLLERKEVSLHELDAFDFTVIGMGKIGAKELNYISDVDVLYVMQPKFHSQSQSQSSNPSHECNEKKKEISQFSESQIISTATKIAMQLQHIVETSNSQPMLWPLDTNLRPEGRDGSLVRTLASYMQYYRRWAKGWEFQALLRARPVAGSKQLGNDFVQSISSLIWEASHKPGFVEETQKMRRQVEAGATKRQRTNSYAVRTYKNVGTVTTIDTDRRLKLGPGGLRDVEFTIQLLQLVHGRTDESIRINSTFAAIHALCQGGYIGRKDSAELEEAYRFLRVLEHRLQLYRMQRAHDIPSDLPRLRCLGRAMGAELELGDAQKIEDMWVETKKRVRQLHLAIFYRPLLPETAHLSAEDISLSANAAQDRLEAIGYTDSKRALTHIKAMTDGVSRSAKIQKQILPVLLGWIAQGPKPYMGIINFRILSEQMGHTSWYLRLLRDSSVAALRLCKLLSTSSFVSEQIPRVPQAVAWLDNEDDLRPRNKEEILHAAKAVVARRTSTPEQAIFSLRNLRRDEILRCAIGDVIGENQPQTARFSLSGAMDAVIQVGLEIEISANCVKFGISEPPTEIALVALGRLGSQELSYSSDADLMFIHEPTPNSGPELAQEFSTSVCKDLLNHFGSLNSHLPLIVDTHLRPEGKNGPLVRTLAGYRKYCKQWIEPWERQALLRARVIVASPQIKHKILEIIDPLRYPENPDLELLTSLRRMKARVEEYRLPKGIDPVRHLKIGPGGISDVEWVVQIWQIAYGYEFEQLRTTSTIDGLRAAAEAGICSGTEAEILHNAWIYASRLRDAMALGATKIASGKSDVLTSDVWELEVVSRLLGNLPGKRVEVEESQARLSRQARAVAEKYLFGSN